MKTFGIFLINAGIMLVLSLPLHFILYISGLAFINKYILIVISYGIGLFLAIRSVSKNIYFTKVQVRQVPVYGLITGLIYAYFSEHTKNVLIPIILVTVMFSVGNWFFLKSKKLENEKAFR